MNIILTIAIFFPFYSESLEGLGVDSEKFLIISTLVLNIYLARRLFKGRYVFDKQRLLPLLVFAVLSLFVYLSANDLELFLRYALAINIAIYLIVLDVKYTQTQFGLLLIVVIYFVDYQSILNSYLLASRGALTAGPISIALICCALVLVSMKIQAEISTSTSTSTKIQKKINQFVFIPSLVLIILSKSKGPVVAFIARLILDSKKYSTRFVYLLLGLTVFSIILVKSDILRLDAISDRLWLQSMLIKNMSLLPHGINSSVFDFGNYPHSALIQLLYEYGVLAGGLIIMLAMLMLKLYGNSLAYLFVLSMFFSFNINNILPIIFVLCFFRNKQRSVARPQKQMKKFRKNGSNGIGHY